MIKQAVLDDVKKVLEYLKFEGNLNTTLLSNIERYGLEKDFLNVWFQVDNDIINAVIMRYFNYLYIYSKDCRCNIDELESFISFTSSDIIMGKSAVLDELANSFNDMILEPSFLMVLKNPQHLLHSNQTEKASLDDCHELGLLTYSIPEFARFYNSPREIEKGIQRRMEMGLSRYFVKRVNGVIASQAYTTIESADYATIGGVVTRPEFQNQGLASQVVSSITRDILKDEKSPNLLYNNHKAGHVYQKIGFENVCEYATLLSSKYLLIKKPTDGGAT